MNLTGTDREVNDMIFAVLLGLIHLCGKVLVFAKRCQNLEQAGAERGTGVYGPDVTLWVI